MKNKIARRELHPKTANTIWLILAPQIQTSSLKLILQDVAK
jgi:hypothetical protein